MSQATTHALWGALCAGVLPPPSRLGLAREPPQFLGCFNCTSRWWPGPSRTIGRYDSANARTPSSGSATRQGSSSRSPLPRCPEHNHAGDRSAASLGPQRLAIGDGVAKPVRAGESSSARLGVRCGPRRPNSCRYGHETSCSPSVQVSTPGPPSSRSMSAPPSRMSSPKLPTRPSGPRPPYRRSLLCPPSMRS